MKYVTHILLTTITSFPRGLTLSLDSKHASLAIDAFPSEAVASTIQMATSGVVVSGVDGFSLETAAGKSDGRLTLN